MALDVLDIDFSGTTDGSGNLTIEKEPSPAYWCTLKVIAQVGGTPVWVVEVNQRAVTFGLGPRVDLGPLLIQPTEKLQVVVGGAQPNAAVTGKLIGITGRLEDVIESFTPIPNTFSLQTQVIQSVSDPTAFPPIINHQRQIITNIVDYEYDEFQIGRLLGRDNFENSTLQWDNIAGASVATDTAFFLKGTQSLKLTTVAGAGNQAIARKFFQIPADQFASKFPLVGVEVWFRFDDGNARDVQLFVRPDDSFIRWQPAIRFFNQNAGVAQNRPQYLDASGNFQDFAVYNIRQGANNPGAPWHHMMIGLNYLQGFTAPPAYCTYQMAKFDDFTWKPASSSGATWNFNNPASQQIASNGFRELAVDLIVTGDNAAATAVSFDEFFVVDLSNAFQL